MFKLPTIFALSSLSIATLMAIDSPSSDKRLLKSNGTLSYKTLPESAEGYMKMFSKSQWYGRIRSNTFVFDYNQEVEAADKKSDHLVSALGGSLVYKTAPYYGVSFTAGAYFSQAFGTLSDGEVNEYRAGKDTFSRYSVANAGGYSLFSMAEYFAQYELGNTRFRLGQQMYESLLTRSNDTKMIPNSFMGLSVENRDFTQWVFRAYYFISQKLRDHQTNHDFVTYEDGLSAIRPEWNNNDDSAVNKSLTYAALKAAKMSTDHEMNGAEAHYNNNDGLDIVYTHNMVPEIVLQEAVEATYPLEMGDIAVKPALRFIGQKDLTAGRLSNIANLRGKTQGYTSPNSLSSYLTAGRIDVEVNSFTKLRYGISYVADLADIMAMWRGFPTGGYTRAMGQYNWQANTLVNQLRLDFDFDKAKLADGLTLLARFAMQNFDETKPGQQADTNVIHVDLSQNLQKIASGLSAKVRVAVLFDARNTIEQSKDNASGGDYRFEVNYLF